MPAKNLPATIRLRLVAFADSRGPISMVTAHSMNDARRPRASAKPPPVKLPRAAPASVLLTTCGGAVGVYREGLECDDSSQLVLGPAGSRHCLVCLHCRCCKDTGHALAWTCSYCPNLRATCPVVGVCCQEQSKMVSDSQTRADVCLPVLREPGCRRSPAPWRSAPVAHSRHPGGSRTQTHPYRRLLLLLVLRPCLGTLSLRLLLLMLHGGPGGAELAPCWRTLTAREHLRVFDVDVTSEYR